MAVDWLRIRNDYINGGGSYRKLAEKYGVSFNTLKEKATTEGWKKERDIQHHKTTTKAQQKTVEKTAEALSDEAAMKVRIRGKILSLAERWIDDIVQVGIQDPGDFRKVVQCCVDLGIASEQEENNNGVLADLIKGLKE